MQPKWYWMFDAYKVKSHFVGEELLTTIKDDLYSRVKDLALTVERCTSGYFDLPGMMSLTALQVEVDLKGLILSIPAWQVEDILGMIKNLKVRVSAEGKEYYKLHGYCRCIVLTPTQRDSFIKQLTSELSRSIAIANLENGEFNKEFVDNPKAFIKVTPRKVRKQTKTGLTH